MRPKSTLLSAVLLGALAAPMGFAIELISHSETPALPTNNADTNLPEAPPFVTQPESVAQNSQITLYNGQIALVNESRFFTLPPGRSTLSISNISPEALPETLHIQFQQYDTQNTPQSSTAISLLEKRLNLNLLTPQSLLEASIGKPITIITTIDGNEKRETATLLTTNGGMILQYQDRIETELSPNSRIAFKELPKDLSFKPSLSLLVENSEEETQHNAIISYLSGGLSWKTDYMATLNLTEDRLDLAGWVTLNNSSGIDFTKAQIDLIAGDLNFNQSTPAPTMFKQARIAMEAATFDTVNENRERISDYYLYALPEKTDLLSGETKQIALFKRNSIPVTKQYSFESQSPHYRLSPQAQNSRENAKISLHFTNSETENLGFPLPEGNVRIYQDAREYARFAGEDYLQATPQNETVELNLGRAFDITMTREQSDIMKIDAKTWEVEYSLTLNNRKQQNASITINELIASPSNANWELIDSSAPAKLKPNSVSWEIELPQSSTEQVQYRVRYSIPDAEEADL